MDGSVDVLETGRLVKAHTYAKEVAGAGTQQMLTATGSLKVRARRSHSDGQEANTH